MTLGSVIGLVTVGVIALVMVLFPEARALGRGFVKLFIKDMASTPEGAEAIYTEKISELQKTYNEASDSYRMVAGEYEHSKKDLQELQNRLTLVERQCEALMRNGNEEHAIVKAQERQEIIEDISRVSSMMDKYEAAMKEAKVISETCERQLIDMKKEMKDTIQEMKDNKRISEVYQKMDKLRADSGTDRMISAIHEKNEELSKMASGSKAVYQNSTAAKVQAVEKDVRRMESDAYLASLRAKYNSPVGIEEKKNFDSKLYKRMATNREAVEVKR